MIFSTPRSVPA